MTTTTTSGIDVTEILDGIESAARAQGLDIAGKYTYEVHGNCVTVTVRLRDGEPLETLEDAKRHGGPGADSLLKITVCHAATGVGGWAWHGHAEVIDVESAEIVDMGDAGWSDEDWEQLTNGGDVKRLNDPKVRKKLREKLPKDPDEAAGRALGPMVTGGRVQPRPAPKAPAPPAPPAPKPAPKIPGGPLVGGGIIVLILILLGWLLLGPKAGPDPAPAAASPKPSAAPSSVTPPASEPADAVANRAPALGPIVATFEWPVTSYALAGSRDPDGDELLVSWDWTGDCGEFSAEGNVARWSHPHDPVSGACTGSFHPATVTATITDGSYECRVVYPYGSDEGRGPAPKDCIPL